VGTDYEYGCESDFIGTIGDNHWVLGEGVSVSHWGIVGSREADHERRHFRELNSNLKLVLAKIARSKLHRPNFTCKLHGKLHIVHGGSPTGM
jgi:hypothetical protein